MQLNFNSLKCTTLALISPIVCFSQKSKIEKPNVIVIFADDEGYGDLGCYGAQRYSTPNFDQLALKGIRFTNFYAAQAVSSASRAGLLTGCYPNRVGISGALFPNSSIGLNPDEELIPELLKNNGYKTAMFGKWHLGDNSHFLPTKQGFDMWLGLPYSNDMWCVNYAGEKINKKGFPPLFLYHNETIIDTIDSKVKMNQITTIYTENVVSYIKQNKKDPFFIYFAHAMPHVPLGVSEKFRGKSGQGMYGDVMMEMDWSLGEILKTLKDCKIEENTLVIFTSDNGPWLNYGNHAGSTGGLREGKGTSFEGGQRVPCIMYWPRKIKTGRVCNRLASTIDLLPTISAVTGSALPQKKIDGLSILPIILNKDTAEIRKDFYYYYNENDLEAVRNENFKLVFPHNHRSYEHVNPNNDGYPGPYSKGVANFALYDLRRDPGERYDVQALYPYEVTKLQIIAENARMELGDKLSNRVGTENRKCGKVIRPNN